MSFRLGGSPDGFNVENDGTINPTAIKDCAASVGTAGQVLSSTGTALEWVAAGGGSSSAAPAAEGTVYGCTLSTNCAVTALGYNAAASLTGSCSTFLGYQAGFAAAGVNRSVFIGSNAGCAITAGQEAVIIGHNAGRTLCNAFGSHLVIGTSAYFNGTGGSNTIIGNGAALQGGGDSMVVVGNDAAYYGTGGSSVAIGYRALYGTSPAGSAPRNTAVGYEAMCNITTGCCNVAMGMWTGCTITTGINNLVLGYGAQTAAATSSNTVTLGNSSITTIRAQVTTITALSDARDKTDITALPVGLDFVNTLNPVKFTWQMRETNEVKDGTSEAGFIAQELLAAQEAAGADYLDLVYDENPEKLEATPGKLLPVLVKAIQELSAKNDALEARIAQLEANG